MYYIYTFYPTTKTLFIQANRRVSEFWIYSIDRSYAVLDTIAYRLDPIVFGSIRVCMISGQTMASYMTSRLRTGMQFYNGINSIEEKKEGYPDNLRVLRPIVVHY